MKVVMCVRFMFLSILLWHTMVGECYLTRIVQPIGHEAIKDWYRTSAIEQDQTCPQCTGWNRITVVDNLGNNLLTENDFVACFASLTNSRRPTRVNGKPRVSYKWGMRWRASRPKRLNQTWMVGVECDQLGPAYRDDLKYRWFSAQKNESFYLEFNQSKEFGAAEKYFVEGGTTRVPGGNRFQRDRLLSMSDNDVIVMKPFRCSQCSHFDPNCMPYGNTCYKSVPPSCEDCKHNVMQCRYSHIEHVCKDKNVPTNFCEHKTSNSTCGVSRTYSQLQCKKDDSAMSCPVVDYADKIVKRKKVVYEMRNASHASTNVTLLKSAMCEKLTTVTNDFECKSNVELYKTKMVSSTLVVSNSTTSYKHLENMYSYACHTLNIKECCANYDIAPCSEDSKCCFTLAV